MKYPFMIFVFCLTIFMTHASETNKNTNSYGTRSSSSGAPNTGSNGKAQQPFVNSVNSGAPRIFSAAVNSKHTFESRPVPVQFAPGEVTVVEVDSQPFPMEILFKYISGLINARQIHQGSVGGLVQETSSEDEPHRLFHQVKKPIIQEVREIITPFRKVIQEVKPVQEDIQTIVASSGRGNGGSGSAPSFGAQGSSGLSGSPGSSGSSESFGLTGLSGSPGSSGSSGPSALSVASIGSFLSNPQLNSRNEFINRKQTIEIQPVQELSGPLDPQITNNIPNSAIQPENGVGKPVVETINISSSSQPEITEHTSSSEAENPNETNAEPNEPEYVGILEGFNQANPNENQNYNQ